MGAPEKAIAPPFASSGEIARAKGHDLIGGVMADVGAAKIGDAGTGAPIACDLFFVRPERAIIIRYVADAAKPDACCAAHFRVHHDRLHGAVDAVEVLAEVLKHDDAAGEIGRPRKTNEMRHDGDVERHRRRLPGVRFNPVGFSKDEKIKRATNCRRAAFANEIRWHRSVNGLSNSERIEPGEDDAGVGIAEIGFGACGGVKFSEQSIIEPPGAVTAAGEPHRIKPGIVCDFEEGGAAFGVGSSEMARLAKTLRMKMKLRRVSAMFGRNLAEFLGEVGRNGAAGANKSNIYGGSRHRRNAYHLLVNFRYIDPAMTETKDYFFCGVGGSGMLPLAVILKARGHIVAGSDRALDQGRTTEKFDYLRMQGVRLFPQDGSGLKRERQILVASAAVEDTVPDVAAANALGAQRISRAELLADLFNGASAPIGVAGTSGKSTTTGMIGWILYCAGREPTVMNGAVMKNFAGEDALFASAIVGGNDVFVSEVDESDGSIAMYNPKIAVLNNIALDHKSMDELRALFSEFIERADVAVLNLDNDETRALACARSAPKITYSLGDHDADLIAEHIAPQPFGATFAVAARDGERVGVRLRMPGLHNVSNALAAIAAANACGVELSVAAAALGDFAGVKRRLEFVGEAKGVTIIDDFAHNPDKISASLAALHEFPGRLLIMFQPHGFGPLNKMKTEFIAAFSDRLSADDVLLLSPPAYFGGTVDRSVTHEDIVASVVAKGRKAEALTSREACGERLLELAKPGDRIIVMGARDDTLSTFADEIVARLT